MAVSDEYSVLMSVYHKENPEFFRLAMKGAILQSRPPKQIVLVCDGLLTEALEKVISETKEILNDTLTVVRLTEHVGLGPALNQGLQACICEYVARMDTDDVSVPERCERQLSFMLLKQLDVSSGTIAEFADDPKKISGYRTLPCEHSTLKKYAKKRNPINHPCAMFRKSAVDEVGGYRDMPYFEDYDLWVRMLMNGATLGNLNRVLAYMRVGNGMINRRGGVAYVRHMRRLYRSFRESRFINRIEYAKIVSLRSVVSLLPTGVRALIYRLVLRESEGKKHE